MPARRDAAFREKDALRLVTALMSVPGRSGQEGRVAAFVRETLTAAGVPARANSTDAANHKSPIGGECGNLIVKLPGSVRGPRRLLMAHLDTVPLCVGSKPVRRGDRIASKDRSTGLGGDDRAGVAVVLQAALTVLRNDLPHPPLTLFFPVQEEIGLLGSRHANVAKLGRPGLCFNWDGGDPAAVTIGATGASAMEVVVRGVASHAGVHPEDGVSAAAIASRAVADLDRNGWHGLVAKDGGTGTSNVGVLAGGEATNVVMPELRVRAEARSHEARFRERIVAEYEAAFRRAAGEVRNIRGATGAVDFHAELKYDSFRLAEDEPVVRAAAEAVRRTGREPRFVVGNGGL
ncbi:MAG TPA: M20/M25/M40 family metallo-hydrolase, partial [Planctomycetaceae bacterium]